MSVKEELHALVDQLADERTVEALAYLRTLVTKNGSSQARGSDRLEAQMNPSLVSGRDFFAQPKRDLETLAAQQGVEPVNDFDESLGDFWPDDETPDEFIAAVREWRSDGDHA